MPELHEVSDAIVDFDPATLERRPVRKREVVERLRSAGDPRAASIVEGLPDRDGILDPDHVDRLLITVHCELQRLSEEFQHGRRVLELLTPMFDALKRSGVPGPYRAVDIGCGTGFVLRWLSARANFRPDVHLLGVDFNRALIAEARRLADLERLGCRFEVANAFTLEKPATIFISTGVLHHFRGDGLTSFFRGQDRPGTHGFAHFDFQPNILARPGAWLFHAIRMRQPLSRHDGVISARRAHSADTLLSAARQTSFRCGMYSRRIGRLPIPRVFQTVLGVRADLADAFRQALGNRLGRLEALS